MFCWSLLSSAILTAIENNNVFTTKAILHIPWNAHGTANRSAIPVDLDRKQLYPLTLFCGHIHAEAIEESCWCIIRICLDISCNSYNRNPDEGRGSTDVENTELKIIADTLTTAH